MILAPRHLSRLAALAGLFTRYGLLGFARDQGLDTLPGEQSDAPEDAGEATPEKAVAFRERLVELGPAYIKLGQLLSSRPDLLPPAYIEELRKLQDSVEPVPFNEIAEVVEAELGGRLSKLFDSFSEEPLGTASLGQAHAATLRGGRDVVVKVQRPKIREALAADVEFFREAAEFMTSHTAAGRRVDMVGIIHQLERALAEELDYRVEARNAAHFRKSLAEFPRLIAPRVIDGYSTERVLTTERVRGIKVDDISPITRTEIDFEPVADQLMQAYLKQITIEGHFHADPHPGNVFVVLPDTQNPMTPSEIVAVEGRVEVSEEVPTSNTPLAKAEVAARAAATLPAAPEEARLALIDFGMTARLSPGMRDACVRMLFGLADDRGDDVAESLMELGEKLPDFDKKRFFADVADVVGRTTRMSAGERDAGIVLYAVINASYQRGLRLPSELTLLAKALAHLGVITRSLDPTYEPVETVRRYMAQIATDRARSQMNPRQLYKIVTESANLARALPHRIDRITKQLAENEFRTRFDFPQMHVLLEGLQKVANRVFSGLVLAGLLVASAMLLPQRRFLGTAGFIIAGALALYMVLTIIATDYRQRKT